MRKIETTLHNLFSILALLFIVAVIALPILGFVTMDTVETYAFHATVTDKAVVDERYQPRCYVLFFVDGDDAGEVWVTSADYARHSIGDLIRVEVEVRENIFGEIEENYEFGVDR